MVIIVFVCHWCVPLVMPCGSSKVIKHIVLILLIAKAKYRLHCDVQSRKHVEWQHP